MSTTNSLSVQRQHKVDVAYIKMAQVWAELSHATRKKVGALIVKNNTIIADGFNGTPSGFENECEEAVMNEDGSFREYKTKWYVLHAESNALAKVAKSTQSCDGSTLYITYSPCTDCSKLILQAGIKKVVYLEEYRDIAGLDFLRRAGVDVKKISLDSI
jgi:dCMP deaminase